MELTLASRIRNAWNIFKNKDPTYELKDLGESYSYRMDRPVFHRGNEKTIVTSIYNKIAIDVSEVDIRHCRVDDENNFKEEISSGLNNCFKLEANIDQSSRSFIQDIVITMFDEGCVAIVPIDTSIDPKNTSSYDILTMRVGTIVQWYPNHVKVRIYNDRTGKKEEVTVSKHNAAIIENPFYAVINEPNSTMRRLIRKLSILDAIDEQSGSGKLDLIIQLPYLVKTESRRKQAEQRRQDIENQLAGSKYGIAYTDGTEKITQINRAVENNLMSQIEYLTNMLFSQLGITQSILDGTADEKTMLNYINRTVNPIVNAIVDELKRKFISKTARTQGQTVMAFRDPFKLVPINNIADIADKFTRNEIMSSNELRQKIGLKPSDDKKADMLINSNLNHNPEEFGNEKETNDNEKSEEKE